MRLTSLQMSSGLIQYFFFPPRLTDIAVDIAPASPSEQIMWCLMLCKEKIMRSSLFKPVIMPGRSAMWRGDPEPGIKKIENKRIGAGSSKHRGSAIRKGQGGLVLTCNPDPGLPLIPLWSHYGVVRVSLVPVPGSEHSIRHSRDDGRLDQRERARVRDNTMTCILSQATLATPGLASN